MWKWTRFLRRQGAAGSSWLLSSFYQNLRWTLNVKRYAHSGSKLSLRTWFSLLFSAATKAVLFLAKIVGQGCAGCDTLSHIFKILTSAYTFSGHSQAFLNCCRNGGNLSSLSLQIVAWHTLVYDTLRVHSPAWKVLQKRPQNSSLSRSIGNFELGYFNANGLVLPALDWRAGCSHEMQSQVYWDGLCSISLQLLCLRWSLFGSPIVSLRSPGPRSFTVSPTDVQPLCLDQSPKTKGRSFNGREATPKTQNCSCFQGKTWQELWNLGAPYLPGQLPFALRSGPLVFA